MFAQHCIKGIWGSGGGFDGGISDVTADLMTAGGSGIVCNWWRNKGQATPAEWRAKLTAENLDRHIHDYDAFSDETPFISLTAGCVSRDAALSINRLHEAEDVALRFATEFGRRTGYLFHCWVIVGLRKAVTVEGVAEEVRELNTYMSWSDFQLEGEVTAKRHVPSNQIARWERWDPVPGNPGRVRMARSKANPKFDPPEIVSNIRGLIEAP